MPNMDVNKMINLFVIKYMSFDRGEWNKIRQLILEIM